MCYCCALEKDGEDAKARQEAGNCEGSAEACGGEEGGAVGWRVQRMKLDSKAFVEVKAGRKGRNGGGSERIDLGLQVMK